MANRPTLRTFAFRIRHRRRNRPRSRPIPKCLNLLRPRRGERHCRRSTHRSGFEWPAAACWRTRHRALSVLRPQFPRRSTLGGRCHSIQIEFRRIPLPPRQLEANICFRSAWFGKSTKNSSSKPSFADQFRRQRRHVVARGRHEYRRFALLHPGKKRTPADAKKRPHPPTPNPARSRQKLFPIRRSKARTATAPQPPETLSEFASQSRRCTCRRSQPYRT